MKKIILVSLLLGMFCFPASLLAQAEPEDIASNEDKFQDSFYEALRQKGIENYDKAIEALEKCQKEQPNNATVFFELGKNYFYLKNYDKSYEAYENATKIDSKNRWFWHGMYDVTYETKDYNKSITLVQKLIEFNDSYKEDLVSLYMYTKQYDKALSLINELNETIGKSDKRELYKADILRDAKYQGSEKDNLIALIKKNPKEEANYISLIYLYSSSNQEEKALEVAKDLEKEIPTSDWAQVSLFKYHLSNNDGEKAIKSMNIVLPSAKIDAKIKHRVLNEFLLFSKDKPQYDADLEKAISYFDNDKEVKVNKEIGKFFYAKKNWSKSARFFENHLKNNPDDMEATQLLLQAYTENKQFDVLSKKATETIDLYPMQPQLYYYAGLGYNQVANFKKAKEFLEMGLDYLVDDIALEINFNIQLGEAYAGLGDTKKKETYFAKAEKLLKQKK
ncbi:MAG: tetratricopeptide repeat protein [Flavobacterium sp.]|uniref:tetratricopeptide repeat protein n=1 Tax=Flavobacterium sp. TaxID=239 RepID=UPI0022CA3012|nr:tetratricopeptide repeat protein [Flavobacterium sp.]MCZ8197490.1 tetratricopeptide repeat protein [Flavobacterium sp.]